MSDWYVVVNGQEKGPYSAKQIRNAVNQGKINEETMLRKSSMNEAVPAGQIKGLLSPAQAQTTSRRRKRAASKKQGTGRRTKQQDSSALTDVDYGEGKDDAALPDQQQEFDAFARDEEYVKHVNKHHISDNYYIEALKAFIFPLSMNAMAFLLGYIVLGLIFVYAGIFLINAWSGFHYIFFFLCIWFVLYFCAYLMRIGQRSAEGDMKSPVWPELGAMLEEIIGPAAMLIGAWIVLRLPYIAVAWGNADYLPVSHDLVGVLAGVDTYLFHAFDLMLRLPNEGIEYVMQAISFLLLPIGMVFIIVKGSFIGLNPGPLFKTTFSIMPEYLVCLLLFCVCQVAMMLIGAEVAATFNLDQTMCFAYMSFDYFPEQGFMDILKFLALGIIPIGYLLMVQFRLLGLLYYTKSEEFL